MKKEPAGYAPSFWEGVAITCFVLAFLAAATGSLLTTNWIFNGQRDCTPRV